MDIVEQIVSNINSRELEKAKDIISKNENKHAKNVDFLSAKAMYYINTGEHRTAIDILKAALEIEPENNDLYYNLAYAYEALDNSNNKASDIIIKNYSKRINHEKGTHMPTRTQSSLSAIEKDAPLVSVIVLAYNKVEYTKQCIESIYKYTDDVDYELILVDNGSTDETFEYFKSLPKRRIVRLEENQGGCVGFNEGIKASIGRYVAVVCNDFIFTKNWLSNLVKCIQSDESIGYVSPGSSYISNCQQINLKFSNIDEMQAEAAKYNTTDPKKWEERIRLLPNVLFVKREVFDIVGYFDSAFYYGEFADDDLSFRIRQAGYKLMFCGDTFTHHFGHVTGGTDQRENDSLELSRKLFIQKHNGIDTWTDVKYDINLMSLFETSKIPQKSKIRILGIDVRCGNTILMVKNKLKQEGYKDIELCAFVQNPIYYQDLKTICNEVKVGDIEYLLNERKDDLYDIIIFDESINTYFNSESIIDKGLLLLKQPGQALMSFINTYDANNIINILTSKSAANNVIKSSFNFERFVQYLENNNHYKISVLKEYHPLTSEDNNLISNVANKVALDNNIELLLDKLKIYRYVINLLK